ncbi:MAG: hypothetical protein IPL27_14540 [Lewinellaceae bacterium]|nr:hypothetical protein [Lewinellaceae bacterium]
MVKRVSRRPIGTFEGTKRALSERIKRDSRSEISKQSMIARIKKKAGIRNIRMYWLNGRPVSWIPFL